MALLRISERVGYLEQRSLTHKLFLNMNLYLDGQKVNFTWWKLTINAEFDNIFFQVETVL